MLGFSVVAGDGGCKVTVFPHRTDLDAHLAFFVECRRSFSKLDAVTEACVMGVLRLVSRGRVVEIGRDLAAEEKAALHHALAGALARARRPDFDNPQLRDG